MRVWASALLFLLVAFAAAARADSAALVHFADSYEKEIAARTNDQAVPELLTSLNRARTEGRTADVLRLSEAIVGLDISNARSWLDLARAWLAQDTRGSKGLGAAVRATGLARTRGQRVEGLLLVSAFLRHRLDDARKRYDTAQAAMQAADAGYALQDVIDDEEAGNVLPSPDRPQQREQRLDAKYAAADDDAKAAAEEISQLAAELDGVYAQLQDGLPELQDTDLRLDDSRLDFRVAQEPNPNEPGEEFPKVSITSGQEGIVACIEFTKELADDPSAHNDYVKVTRYGSPDMVLSASDYDLRVDGTRLCLLRLEPGSTYSVALTAGLPSADGQRLAEDVEAQVGLPDLKMRVGFGDAEFILPQSGTGELPIYLTNAKTDVPLSLHRISDRTLYRHLALGHISNGIPSREYRDLLRHFSETLWQGYARRALKPDERNHVVRTFVPVRTILEDREDWLKQTDWSDRDERGVQRSVEAPVRAVSDDLLTLRGSYLGDPLGAAEELAGRHEAGVYVLVAQVPESDEVRDQYCFDDGDDCQVFATQWFMTTNIGLTFYEGDRGFNVVARALDTGKPVAGAHVELISQGNRVLAEGTTSADGVASFARSLTAGSGSNELVAILAHTDDDFSFIKYGSERLDLSRLNVSGHAGEAETRALLYTDRGIYQPGEKIAALALIRNRYATLGTPDAELRLAVSDLAAVRRPIEASEWHEGGALVDFAIPEQTRPGRATLSLVAPSGQELASTDVEIGQIRPDRARIRFDDSAMTASLGPDGLATISGRARAQYLYGAENSGQAPASGLKANITVRVMPVQTPVNGCFAGYTFGAFDDATLPAVSRNFIEYTGDDGAIEFTLPGVRLPETDQPLSAVVEVTLFDASGPIASRQSEMRLPARQVMLGLSSVPHLAPDQFGYRLDLPVAVVGTNGAADFGHRIDVTIEREREFYAWENVDGSWQHIRTRRREAVDTTQVDLSSLQPMSIAGCPSVVTIAGAADNLPDGRYVVTVRDPQSGTMASTRFTTGVAQTSVDDLEPNIFVLSTSRERYAVGETVELTIAAPFEQGEVLVGIADSDIVSWHSGTIADGSATITFPATEDLGGKGWYALAYAYRSEQGERARPGPARAVGAAYFEVSNEQQAFRLALRRRSASLDDFVRPEEPLSFDVCVAGPDGQCAAQAPAGIQAVAFVVDEGLLGLTGHEAKATRVEQAFTGRAALQIRVMDNYGRLMLKEGGDLPGRLALANYTSNRIVAASRGPVELRDGKASFTFADLGLESGSLSVYVVAWSRKAVASARDTVAVHRRLVANLSLPDFFMAGDSPILPLRLENISLSTGPDFTLALDTGGAFEASLMGLGGEAVRSDGNGRYHVPIPVGEPQDLFVALDLPRGQSGTHDLRLHLADSDGNDTLPEQERDRDWRFDVRPAGVEVQQYLSFPLSKRPVDLAALLDSQVADFERDTVKISARFATEQDLLRLAAGEIPAGEGETQLDGLVWKGMIELAQWASSGDAATRGRLQNTVDNIQALQFVDGAFVPYRTDGDFTPTEIGADTNDGFRPITYGMLRTSAAVDLLERARNAGLSVASAALARGLANLHQRIDYIRLREGVCNFESQYAMLLLAQANQFDSNWLDYTKNCHADALAGRMGDEEETDGDAQAQQETDAATMPVSGVLAGLVTNAVLVEYGDLADTDELLSARYGAPSNYLRDLEPYERALALSMLAHAGTDPDAVRVIAASFVGGGADGQPDLRARAWLARAALDIGPPPAGLSVSDIVVTPVGALPVVKNMKGIVDTGEVGFEELRDKDISVAAAGDTGGRGQIRISGRLLAEDYRALPRSAFGMRFFRADNGDELDMAKQALSVGDRVVVVLEGTTLATGPLIGAIQPDLSQSDGALALDVTLPSALAVVADGLPDVPDDSDLGQLEPAGNPRSVTSNVQRWRAVVVPESMRPSVENPTEPSAYDPADDLEFRQGFTARVTAAGKFTFPAARIDAVELPGSTLLAQPLTFQVPVPNRDFR